MTSWAYEVSTCTCPLHGDEVCGKKANLRLTVQGGTTAEDEATACNGCCGALVQHLLSGIEGSVLVTEI